MAAYRGTTPAIVAAGLLTFLLGLEALEPLAQELDHPERTDALPVEPGRLHQRLSIVPAIVLVAFGLGGAAFVVLVERSQDAIAIGAVLGPTVALAGGAGAALNTIGGAPDPFAAEASGAMLPPEVAGLSMVVRLLWPPLISIAGFVPVLLAREAAESGQSAAAAAAQASVGVLVVVALVAMWIEKRPAFRVWWQTFKSDATGKPSVSRSSGGDAA